MVWYVRPLVRMLGSGVATLLVASVVIYGGLAASPGDPAAVLAGEKATPEQIAQIRSNLHLDQPLVERYASWAGDALTGDLGISFQYGDDVSSLIGGRLGVSLTLAAYAFLIVLVMGIGLGMVPVFFRRLSWLVTAIAGIGVAVPVFVSALILIQVFALWLGWFPALGQGQGFLGGLRFMTLPAFALAISWGAYLAQITRTSLLTEEQRDHVETATGRGVRPSRVFRKHVARNATMPILSVSTLTAAGLIAHTIIVEQIFGLGGIGSLLIAAVLNKDFNVVMATSMIYACAFVIATITIDIAHLMLDPRVRAGALR